MEVVSVEVKVEGSKLAVVRFLCRLGPHANDKNWWAAGDDGHTVCTAIIPQNMSE